MTYDKKQYEPKENLKRCVFNKMSTNEPVKDLNLKL